MKFQEQKTSPYFFQSFIILYMEKSREKLKCERSMGKASIECICTKLVCSTGNGNEKPWTPVDALKRGKVA